MSNLATVNPADSLLGFDPRLRCSCTLWQGKDRCARKATGEDMRCDSCRTSACYSPETLYVSESAFRDYPERVADLLAARRGHCVLLPHAPAEIP